MNALRMEPVMLQDVLPPASEGARAVTRLPLLGAAERAQILHGWNSSTLSWPAGRCIHELIEQQVERTPQALALAFGGSTLSYAELDARANQLARHLVAIGVRPDARVAIALPRGPEMVVAVLATLKAGGAYVPMDLGYPADRLAWMREDSAPVALITRRDARAVLGSLAQDITLIELDAEAQPWSGQPRGKLDPAELGLCPSHLAYVIYTSGSTGRPKGVMIEHAGLCSLAAALIEGFGVRSDSRVLQLASFSFDACISEIVMALCCGATLCLPRPGALVGRELREVLESERITHATIVPSVLATLPSDAQLPHLQTLVVAGEAVGRDLVERWAPGRRMVNAYGPTETTVCASMQDCDPAQPGSPGIGRAIANIRIYILDAWGEPVPIGVVGELYIGGGAVARGYLNRPELSAERFVADPFAPPDASPAARMFRTGDLGRWRPDGSIEFLGRNDHQVKIRGLRIELGEIEATLAAHPAVRQVAVLARDDAGPGRRLVAYVASEAAPEELLAALRARLREALPEHMMPASFVVLARMPMTPNGKLDRQALPAPVPATPAADATAPRNPVEQSIWAIWRTLLGHASFGVLDSFFDAGGDSLLAVELHAQLEAQFAMKLPVSLVLEAPSVALQAALLQGAARANDSLLLIRPGTHAPAVFLVHDGFGETLVYRGLAHLLAPGTPVYGLCPAPSEGIALPHTRIDEIAASYVARIRRVQPHGPYLLGGLCAGGVIAFEMARQLQREGQAIGMLALMDANDVAARRRIGRYGRDRIEAYSGAMGRRLSLAKPLASLKDLSGLVALFARLLRQHLAVRLAHGRGQLKARVLRYCLDRGRSPPAFVRSLSVDQIYALAESSHADPGRFEGELLLFRATAGNGDFGDEPYKNLYTDPLLGWGERVRGQVHRLDIGGGHYSMFQEPHVRAVADTLQAHIDKARRGRPQDAA